MQRYSLIQDIIHGKFDKSVHFSVSFILTALALIMFPINTALLTVFAIGLAKEIVDGINPKKKFDFLDLVTNVLGIVSAYILWEVILITILS